MKCTELHETDVSNFHVTKKSLGELGSNEQNNAMPSKNVSELCPTLPCLEVAKHKFSGQI